MAHQVRCPCGRTFTAKRSTARFCCDLHRLPAHRGTRFTDPTEAPPPKPPSSGTDRVAWYSRDRHRLWIRLGFKPTLVDHLLILGRLHRDGTRDGLYWCGRSGEASALRLMRGIHLINVEPGEIFLPSWWLDWHYGADPLAAAVSTLLLAVPFEDWPRMLRSIIRGVHPDHLSEDTPAAQALLLRLNSAIDELRRARNNPY